MNGAKHVGDKMKRGRSSASISGVEGDTTTWMSTDPSFVGSEWDSDEDSRSVGTASTSSYTVRSSRSDDDDDPGVVILDDEESLLSEIIHRTYCSEDDADETARPLLLTGLDDDASLARDGNDRGQHLDGTTTTTTTNVVVVSASQPPPSSSSRPSPSLASRLYKGTMTLFRKDNKEGGGSGQKGHVTEQQEDDDDDRGEEETAADVWLGSSREIGSFSRQDSFSTCDDTWGGTSRDDDEDGSILTSYSVRTEKDRMHVEELLEDIPEEELTDDDDDNVSRRNSFDSSSLLEDSSDRDDDDDSFYDRDDDDEEEEDEEIYFTLEGGRSREKDINFNKKILRFIEKEQSRKQNADEIVEVTATTTSSSSSRPQDGSTNYGALVIDQGGNPMPTRQRVFVVESGIEVDWDAREEGSQDSGHGEGWNTRSVLKRNGPTRDDVLKDISNNDVHREANNCLDSDDGFGKHIPRRKSSLGQPPPDKREESASLHRALSRFSTQKSSSWDSQPRRLSRTRSRDMISYRSLPMHPFPEEQGQEWTLGFYIAKTTTKASPRREGGVHFGRKRSPMSVTDRDIHHHLCEI